MRWYYMHLVKNRYRALLSHYNLTNCQGAGLPVDRSLLQSRRFRITADFTCTDDEACPVYYLYVWCTMSRHSSPRDVASMIGIRSVSSLEIELTTGPVRLPVSGHGFGSAGHPELIITGQ
jgi:hypothetical protein